MSASRGASMTCRRRACPARQCRSPARRSVGPACASRTSLRGSRARRAASACPRPRGRGRHYTQSRVRRRGCGTWRDPWDAVECLLRTFSTQGSLP
ncbi:hypothetical protein PsYK624_109140 [Phanerochaete sordida]|uniref:Uncharacterized protein n=1 Tax=Phanerochaete sordida TaxID=48140 RepID=A0A9P3GET5_9APHY|nr:hypothetical protein PsYK624_109140 [Phanerochaete sordida]